MNNETGTEEAKSIMTRKGANNLPESPTDIVLPKNRFTKKEKWFIVCITAFVGLFRQAAYIFFTLPAIEFNSTMLL